MDARLAALLSTLRAFVHTVRTAPPVVSLAIGLLAGDALGSRAATVPASLLAAVAGSAVILLVASDIAWRRIGIGLLALIVGSLAAERIHRPTFPVDHVANAPVRVPVALDGVLKADPEARGGRMRVWLRVARIDDGQGWHTAQGDVLLSIRRVEQRWNAGDRLLGTVSLRRPRNFGNPGEFDYAGYLARQGIYVTAYADDDAEFAHLAAGEGGIDGWFARWRRGVGTLIRDTLPRPQSDILSALVIGTATALPADLRGAFNRAGVSHVLSVSGLHVGLVAAVAYALCRWLLARSRWLLLTTNVPKLAAALSIVPVLLYAGIAGSNVATVRSVLMIVVFVAAVVVDRERHLIVSLAAAAILILLLSPGSSQDISFQLSFVAVLGLVLATERFWPWWRRREEVHLLRLRGWRGRVWRPLAVYLVVSVSALAATTPLTALHFNQVSCISVVANALVVPLLGSIAVAVGLLAALLFLVSESLAWVCVWSAGPVVQLGLWLVRFFAAWPYASVHVVTPTPFELLVVYAALLSVLTFTGRARVALLGMLAVAAMADGAWWYAERYHRRDLRLTFLSVGQGDAAVVELPGAAVMVIDGGGLGSDTFDVGERVIAPFLWSRKIARVDYLVLSHPQWDHYGGLAYLAEHFQPREFWSNGTTATSPRFAHLQQQLQDHAVREVAMQRGERRRIGGVDVTVESPDPSIAEPSVNDASLVVRLAFNGTRILFPGDIEASAERRLAAGVNGALRSAVLKVPHHGSHTSSSVRFLDAVAPRFAVVSAGFENRFGFPHAEVLQRYDARDCALARTDLDGAVTIRVDADGRIEMHRFLTHHVARQVEIAVDSPGRQG